MARTGSIVKRTLNAIFGTDPEMKQKASLDVDSDIETNGYLKATDLSDAPSGGIFAGLGDDTGAFTWYAEQMQMEVDRKKKYKLYNEMDKESPELSSALDIYADNATQADFDMRDSVIKVDSKDAKVKDILDGFIEDVGLNQSVWGIARNLAKYGEDFNELVVDKSLKARRLKPLDGKTIIRNEDQYGRLQLKAFLQRDPKTEKTVAEFLSWQIVHFRIQKNRNEKYGNGILEPAVRVYRQLSFMEDSMVIARLTRAPQRYAHGVDVDGMTPDEAEKHLDKVKNRMKKRRTINPQTGKQDLNYNPLAAEEDIFYGTREKSKADVKVLQGDTNLSNIKDVFYFQNKLFSATKVPKSYLGLESDVGAKGTVTEQEIQFARTVKRIQNAIIEGLKELFDYVLAINGVAASSAEYRILLPTISMIDELRKWQSRLVKMQVAQLYQTVFHVNAEYLMRTFLNMTEEEVSEIVDNEDEMFLIQKQMAQVNLDIAKNPPPTTGVGGNNQTGGAGNKVGAKAPRDTKHNTSNSANRKTAKVVGIGNNKAQTGMNKNKKAEALKLLATDLVDTPEELLEAVQALLEDIQE